MSQGVGGEGRETPEARGGRSPMTPVWPSSHESVGKTGDREEGCEQVSKASNTREAFPVRKERDLSFLFLFCSFLGALLLAATL